MREIQVYKHIRKSLRELGRDEKWLQSWLCNDLRQLGLGPLELKKQELIQRAGGGRLDILAYLPDLDTYFEIEVMLGEIDASHGFRVLDYWAREKLANPSSRHYAVIVAESLSNRYQTLLQTLSERLEFIGIEMQTLVLEGADAATVGFSIQMMPESFLQLSIPKQAGEKVPLVPRDEEWWIDAKGKAFVDFVYEVRDVCERNIGPSLLDFSASSYVALKKGYRAWLPIWHRKVGGYVYTPNAREVGGEDSPWLEEINVVLGKYALRATWQPKYNAGANPIAFGLRPEMLEDPSVLEILREAYEAA